MDAITLRGYRTSDAPAVSHLFRKIYGDHYAQPHVYLPRMISQNHADRRWHSLVAVANGQVAGHSALILDKGSSLAELALSVVDPQIRGQNVATQMGRHLLIHAQALGYQGVTIKQMTHHPYTQKMAAGLGFHNTGVLPDHAPSPFGGAVTESLVLGYAPGDGYQRPLPALTWPNECREFMQQMCDMFGTRVNVSPWVGAPAQLEQRWGRYDGVFNEVDDSLLKQLQQLPDHWLISIRLRLAQGFDNAWRRLSAMGFVFSGLAPDERGAGWLALFHRGFQPKSLILHCPQMQRLHDDMQRQIAPLIGLQVHANRP
ncbi:GNAT family N-acetyltransferase [Pseudomonas sp. GM25]|uniref:GNAT family N-acetyltransferase n=1 Tax=Pseudomonas sp. GM25 TaxID=1144327 RepID=UPI0002700520|nr:GNAT family N-acetyltransferase [Pseudomonas sp. GM25]EJM25502.1 acetyltransferase, N-acetylglutamate synthase [Pseudomonas sp. GM25]